MGSRYKHWTVLETKSASSLDASKHVRDQGFEFYRPLYRTQPHPINHVRHVKQLFERYLFVLVDRRVNWQILNSTRGVHRLFLEGKMPCEISNEHVEWIKSCEGPDGYFVVQQEEPPVFSTKQIVRGIRGLFEDLQGIYLGYGANTRDHTRRVLFTMMGRDVVFEVPAHDLVAA